MATRIFKQIRQTRSLFTQLIDQLTPDQLNHIPEGFRNNPIWNYGHIAVTTPLLCYKRSGANPNLEIPFQAAYQKDSVPTYQVGETEVKELKEYIITSIDQLEKDEKSGLFQQITPFNTSTYGLELLDFKDILLTTLMHDNLHLGYAKAQLKAQITK